jgi:hypothetical protein
MLEHPLLSRLRRRGFSTPDWHKIVSLTVSVLMILTGVAQGWEWFLNKIDREGEKLGEWRLGAMGVSGHEVFDLKRNYNEDTLSSEIELSSLDRYDSKLPS